MLKQVTFRTPNKMEIHTGHVTFDRQADCISTGNVLGLSQLSFYIRPFIETECNGRIWTEGCLQDYDLKQFGSDLPSFVRETVKKLAIFKSVILYQIRHWRGENKFVHGYIITDGKHRFLQAFSTGSTCKSERIIIEVLPYIAEDIPGHWR